MGKKLLVFLILIALLFVAYTKYNRMTTMERSLTSQLTLIESQYQLKSDVIFELSKNLNSNLEEELAIAENIRLTRNAAAKIDLDPANLTEEKLNQFRSAFKEIIALQNELIQISKDYPEISNSQVFRELLTELESTEIRIANERRRLNEQVNIYNKYINGFFNIALAQVLGFRDWPVFTPILGE
jgi:LemA protein